MSRNIGQWRRKREVCSILEPQLESGFKQFLKLYLICAQVNDLTLVGFVWSA